MQRACACGSSSASRPPAPAGSPPGCASAAAHGCVPRCASRRGCDCQIGVFCAYVSRHGHAFIDRALYLPRAWTDDPIRMTATHVPNGIAFATKPALAVKMISQALAANVPFSWVAADSVYGVGDIEMALRHAGKGYV